MFYFWVHTPSRIWQLQACWLLPERSICIPVLCNIKACSAFTQYLTWLHSAYLSSSMVQTLPLLCAYTFTEDLGWYTEFVIVRFSQDTRSKVFPNSDCNGCWDSLLHFGNGCWDWSCCDCNCGYVCSSSVICLSFFIVTLTSFSNCD